jgi:hypothetical protein
LAETASRSALESALALYAPLNRQAVARTFLGALAIDELLFLADFLGSCILTTSAVDIDTWEAFCHHAQRHRTGMKQMTMRQREDADHKLILVTEFAACCGFPIKFR